MARTAAQPDGLIRSAMPVRRCLLPSGGAAALALIVYACTLGGTYIYDDVAIVHEDPRVLRPALWGRLWARPYFDTGNVHAPDKLYRPLVSTSFAIENYLHGDRPWLFHLVNLLLHAAVSGLVALLGVRLGGVACGWIAGLLFAVHPVHVEAVAGLVGRGELACALTTLGAVLLFLRDGPLGPRRMIGIWLCFVVALLSKEQGVIVPMLLLAGAPLRCGPARSSRVAGVLAQGEAEPRDKRAILWLIVLLCWTLAAYFMVRQQVAPLYWGREWLDWDVNPLVRASGRDTWLMPLVLLGRNMALLAFPWKLSIDYGAMVIGWKVSLHDPFPYIGLAVAIGWLIGVVFSIRRRRWAMLWCLLGAAMSYAVIGNVVILIGTIFAERLMYLPSAFVLLAAGLVLSRLRRQILVPVLLLLALAGAARSFAYARQWNDRPHFYEASMVAQPRSERVYALLWNEYREGGDWPAARRVAELARTNVPECWQSYVMCIECDLHRGDFDAADAHADQGLRIYHDYRDLDRMFLVQWKGVIASRRADAAALAPDHASPHNGNGQPN